MKKLVVFLLCVFPILAFGGVGGFSDKREVIGWLRDKPAYYGKGVNNIWDKYPYKNIVFIKGSWGAGGTGVFISPRHVLTNTHVAKGCGMEGQQPCFIIQSDGMGELAKVVLFGGKDRKDDTPNKDWSILEIEDQHFCRKDYFNYKKPTQISSGLWRAGFGGLRVLTSEDIKNIKDAYWKWLGKVYPYNIVERRYDYNSQIDLVWKNKYNIEDPKHGRQWYKTFLTEFKNLTGKDFIDEYLSDGFTLKLIRNCGINEISDGVGTHNCQSWAGDSGSSVLDSSNNIVLLNKGGYRYITSKEEYINEGPVTETIFNIKTQDLIEQAKERCEKLAKGRRIGNKCLKYDMPTHATNGYYVSSLYSRYDCIDGRNNSTNCFCKVTGCENGYSLFEDLCWKDP